MGLNDMIRIIFIKHFVLSKSPLSLCLLNERLIVYFVLLSLLFTAYKKVENCAFQQNPAFPSLQRCLFALPAIGSLNLGH